MGSEEILKSFHEKCESNIIPYIHRAVLFNSFIFSPMIQRSTELLRQKEI